MRTRWYAAVILVSAAFVAGAGPNNLVYRDDLSGSLLVRRSGPGAPTFSDFQKVAGARLSIRTLCDRGDIPCTPAQGLFRISGCLPGASCPGATGTATTTAFDKDISAFPSKLFAFDVTMENGNVCSFRGSVPFELGYAVFTNVLSKQHRHFVPAASGTLREGRPDDGPDIPR